MTFYDGMVYNISMKYKMPKGVCDYLPDECYAKNTTEEQLLNVFRQNGYERIETPCIEYADVFTEHGLFPIETAFKMTDTDGSLILLRPDITMPLSRIVSTKITPVLPLKLCYLGDSFSLLAEDNRYREFTQAGLELIGSNSYLADAEVVALAIEGLRAAGLQDFLIELGSTEILRGLIEECCLDEKDEEELIRSVDKKNHFAITEILNAKGVSRALSNAVTELLTLFGDDALKEAYRLVKPKKSRIALDRLSEVYDALRALGYEKYLSIDPGLLNSMNFYTGIVFKGISRHFGAPILSGGRYDNLFTDKNKSAIPATGFAVGVQNLLTALTRSGNVAERASVDYVIGAKKEQAERAVRLKDRLIRDGFRASYTFIEDEAKLKEYAEKVKAKNIVFVGGE
ncbi:MAG: ATP phosphoribosyltransferase regulatory subunit [Clostridiales bacterium]|nr:ATP phosphoribosyltransferase regulatory subunit [Clostridiales bacterium]